MFINFQKLVVMFKISIKKKYLERKVNGSLTN